MLGPAADGGYYLIGMTQPHPELFSGISWGTENVLLETSERAREIGLSVAFLTELRDVDYPADLTLSVLSRISEYLE